MTPSKLASIFTPVNNFFNNGDIKIMREDIVLKGGSKNGRAHRTFPYTATILWDGETYKRTGEVINGAAVFRWEGEL